MPFISVFSPNPSSWTWYAKNVGGGESWLFRNEEPSNRLERLITRPRLSRIAGAFRCVREANRKRSAAIAAHSQFSTLWTAIAQRVVGCGIPLIACSFHFAELPSGIRLRLARWAFQRVSVFIVHSEPERQRYADRFGLPLDRFRLVRWGVSPSSTQIEEDPPEISGAYICALGKDGRDYRTLILAMTQLAHLNLVVVAQPHNLTDVEIPNNVKILCNIPLERAMNILKHCDFMALPLETETTSCGHITLVSAMFCRKAILATRSTGIADYFPPDYDPASIPAGDVNAWVNELSSMASDADRRNRCAERGEHFAHTHCSDTIALQDTLAVFREAGVVFDLRSENHG